MKQNLCACTERRNKLPFDKSKKAYWKLGPLDVVCGGLALAAIFFWQLTDQPNLAIFFTILADLLAGTPILVKAFKFPETESAWTFLTGLINAVIGLLTLHVWDFAHVAFPRYLSATCFSLFVLIRFRMGTYLMKKI